MWTVRDSGTHRGPNISSFDQEPPIQADPMFTTWTKPVPRSWFYASRKYPMLATDEVPIITDFQRFYARLGADNLPTLTDVAVGVTTHVRFTTDQAGGAGGVLVGFEAETSGLGVGITFYGEEFDGLFFIGGYRANRVVVYNRSGADSAPATDTATRTITH